MQSVYVTLMYYDVNIQTSRRSIYLCDCTL